MSAACHRWCVERHRFNNRTFKTDRLVMSRHKTQAAADMSVPTYWCGEYFKVRRLTTRERGLAPPSDKGGA